MRPNSWVTIAEPSITIAIEIIINVWFGVFRLLHRQAIKIVKMLHINCIR